MFLHNRFPELSPARFSQTCTCAPDKLVLVPHIFLACSCARLCVYSCFLEFPPPHLSRPYLLWPPCSSFWIPCLAPGTEAELQRSCQHGLPRAVSPCVGSECLDGKGLCLSLPSLPDTALAHTRPLQCLWLSESVILYFGPCFYELTGSQWSAVFSSSVPKKNPRLHW